MLRLLRYLGGAIIVGAAFFAPRCGWTDTLNLAGLLLDIVGASILTVAPLTGRAAYFRIAAPVVRGDRSFVQWWILNWPLALVSRLGSSDARNTQPDMEEDVTETVYGFTFLLLGFVGQAISQLISMLA